MLMLSSVVPELLLIILLALQILVALLHVPTAGTAIVTVEV
jgi:hypothetical protein